MSGAKKSVQRCVCPALTFLRSSDVIHLDARAVRAALLQLNVTADKSQNLQEVVSERLLELFLVCSVSGLLQARAVRKAAENKAQLVMLPVRSQELGCLLRVRSNSACV
jgi:hypothetical protein